MKKPTKQEKIVFTATMIIVLLIIVFVFSKLFGSPPSDKTPVATVKATTQSAPKSVTPSKPTSNPVAANVRGVVVPDPFAIIDKAQKDGVNYYAKAEQIPGGDTVAKAVPAQPVNQTQIIAIVGDRATGYVAVVSDGTKKATVKPNSDTVFGRVGAINDGGVMINGKFFEISHSKQPAKKTKSADNVVVSTKPSYNWPDSGK